MITRPELARLKNANFIVSFFYFADEKSTDFIYLWLEFQKYCLKNYSYNMLNPLAVDGKNTYVHRNFSFSVISPVSSASPFP